jgi:hypothetical protein
MLAKRRPKIITQLDYCDDFTSRAARPLVKPPALDEPRGSNS